MRFASFMRELAHRWIAHDNTRSAAAIAYYAIFTFAPTLVVATSVAGWFVGDQHARDLIAERLAKAVGPAGADIAKEVLVDADLFRHSGLVMVVSGCLLLYGASSMFYHLRKALDTIFGPAPTRTPSEALLNTLIGRLISAVCVILGGGLLIMTLIADLTIRSLDTWLVETTTLPSEFWRWANNAGSVVVVSIVVVALFKYLPSTPHSLRYILPGALVAVVLFEAGKWLIGMYISRSVIASAYGPSSSIVAVIVWIYYTMQILLLGAEISRWRMDRLSHS